MARPDWENKFQISDEENSISFHIDTRDVLGECPETRKPDVNWLHVAYGQKDPGGWGVGGYEFIHAQDLEALVTGLMTVFFGNQQQFQYTAGYDQLIKVSLFRNKEERFNFSFSMLETLGRKSYITVNKDGLTQEEVADYIQPLQWMRKKYPVVGTDEKA